MEVTFELHNKLWTLVDLLSEREVDVGTVLNRLLEKALRLQEIKREWIGIMVEKEWTIEEVKTIGIGNPSGRAGITTLYNQQKKVQELQKSRK